MKTKIQQRLYYLFRECLLILCTINIPLLVGCSDDNEMGIINPSQKIIIRFTQYMYRMKTTSNKLIINIL